MNRSFERALELEQWGYHPIPAIEWGKVPPCGFSLFEHFEENIPVAASKKHYTEHGNVGVLTGNLVVWDIDDKSKATELFSRFRSVLKTVTETRRGMHFLFRAPRPGLASQKLDGGDLKASRAYVIFPSSTVWDRTTNTTCNYRFLDRHPLVPFDELPVFDENWLTGVLLRRALTRGKVRNVVPYVMKIESIQGSHGSHGLVRACSVLHDAGYTEAQAMVVLIEWNSSGKAQPPWSLDELARACSNTYSKQGI
jgi:hypothetical protein